MESVTDSTSEPSAEDVALLAVALGQVDAAHRRLRSRAARSLGITVSDLTALIVISDSDGMTPTVLAAELGLSSGAVTAMVDRLDRDGRVYRAPRPGDRRSVVLRLTPHGVAAIETVWLTYLSAVSRAAENSPHLMEAQTLMSLHEAAQAIDSVGELHPAIPISASGAA
jgi:DNA-binding MarR family transcriptional regulator